MTVVPLYTKAQSEIRPILAPGTVCDAPKGAFFVAPVHLIVDLFLKGVKTGLSFMDRRLFCSWFDFKMLFGLMLLTVAVQDSYLK